MSLLDKIKELENQGGEKKSYAETIAYLLKDKVVEIFSGDVANEQITSDTNYNKFSVICGKVYGAYGDCLILNSLCIKDNKICDGNFIFINDINIKAISELDDNGNLHTAVSNTISSKHFKTAFSK